MPRSKPTLVPLHEHPAYAKERGRLTSLQLRLSDIESQLNAGLAAVAARASVRDTQVAALMTNPSTDIRAVDTSQSRRDLDELRAEKRIVAQAIERQRRVLSEIENKLSSEMCTKVRGEYGAIVQAVATKAVELASASAAERDFRDAIQDAGYSAASLEPCPFRRVGTLKDENSYVNFYLSQCRAAAYLS